MKQIVLFFAALLTLILPFGCGTSRNLSSRAIVEEGTGYSMKKDIAFSMAVTNALAKISSEHKVDVTTADSQKYRTSESSKERPAESYTFESAAGTASKMTVSRYEVISREYNYIRSRKQWECKVSVSVDPGNIE